MKGTILWFDNKMGYGFLRDDSTMEEIYFHWTALQVPGEYKTVFTGQPVEFERGTHKNNDEEKVFAFNIVPLERVNNSTGKPLLLVAFADVRGDIHLNDLHFRVSRFQSAGLSYICDIEGFLISADKSLKVEEAKEILKIIKENSKEIESNISQGLRKVFNTTDFKYDIMFL